MAAAVPFVLTLANLPLFRAPAPARRPVPLSVLIPARDEEANIADAVAAVLANRGVEVELVVLDDGSTDGTAAILAAIRDERLRVITGAALPHGWSGKQHACARLAAAARHDLLVFLDADVRLGPDALIRMAGHLERDPDCGLASGFPHQITATWSEILLLPLILFVLLGFLPLARARRSSAPAYGAGCGQVFIARAEAYRRAGGHAAIRASRHDGLTLPRAFRRAGIRTGLFDATDIARCRMYANAGLLWEGLTKNATEGMATPTGLPAWTVVLGLGQVAPLPLLLAAPSGTAAAALACGLLTRLVLARRFRQSLLSVPLHPLAVAALLGVQWASLVRAWRGRPSTWRGRAYPPGAR